MAEITDEHRALVRDMFDTMYDAPGVGLAAPQLGIMQRIIVIDCAKREEDEAESGEVERKSTPVGPVEPIAMINPEILWSSEETSIYEEGCLSIPDFYEEVERPARVGLRYLTPEGEAVEREADGFLATVAQHEIDHLNGKLFIDYISRLKRERIVKKFQKAAKRAG